MTHVNQIIEKYLLNKEMIFNPEFRTLYNSSRFELSPITHPRVDIVSCKASSLSTVKEQFISSQQKKQQNLIDWIYLRKIKLQRAFALDSHSKTTDVYFLVNMLAAASSTNQCRSPQTGFTLAAGSSSVPSSSNTCLRTLALLAPVLTNTEHLAALIIG